MVVDGIPDIFPVNHVVDHGTIVFRTAAGTKLSATHARPVAYEVDGYDAAKGEAWSVVAHGVGRVVYEAEEAIEALGLPIFPWQAGPKPQVVRLTPSTITGRRFRVTGGFRNEPTVTASGEDPLVAGDVSSTGNASSQGKPVI